MTGHSGPVTGVKLSLPFALSAAGCAVRLWDVTQGRGGGLGPKFATVPSNDLVNVSQTFHQISAKNFANMLTFWHCCCVHQGTCLKLLQHDEDSPVTTMTWTSTFKVGLGNKSAF